MVPNDLAYKGKTGKTMNAILIGNLCSLCAMITDSISGTRKERGQILGIQIISQLFFGTSAFVLKGYSALVQNVVAVFRNLAGIKNIKSKAVEWGLIMAGVVFGIIFNNRGLMGWLPVVANFEYSVSVFRFKDRPQALKVAFALNTLMFSAFNFFIKNYVGTVTNLIVTVTTCIALIKEKNEQKISDIS